MIYVNVSLFLEGPSGLPDGDPDRARPLQFTYAIPQGGSGFWTASDRGWGVVSKIEKISDVLNEFGFIKASENFRPSKLFNKPKLHKEVRLLTEKEGT